MTLVLNKNMLLRRPINNHLRITMFPHMFNFTLLAFLCLADQCSPLYACFDTRATTRISPTKGKTTMKL